MSFRQKGCIAGLQRGQGRGIEHGRSQPEPWRGAGVQPSTALPSRRARSVGMGGDMLQGQADMSDI